MENSRIPEETDEDLRSNSGVEGSPAMTIEFLRDRLLAERSVSRAARQRAEELAKRVAELEDQLKIVSLQRKKAEKATIDVLSILENHGISDFSEEFDSSSDQEVDQCKSEVSNEFQEGNGSVGLKTRSKHADEYSTSELESYPSLGRSLSWKSGKQSSPSREKKYIDSSARRRRSFASTKSDSPKLQVGRSCRRIQRREPRSPVEEGSKNDNINSPQEGGVSTCSEGYSTHSDAGSQILGGNAAKPVVEVVKEKPASGDLDNQGHVACDTNYLNKDGSCEDMEMAMERQAQLIGRYQEEEKAQREWEEKFRENENSSPDSCEPGNQSDVTEEREEANVHAPPFSVSSIASRDLKEKPTLEAISGIEESSKSQPNGLQSPQRVDVECLKEKSPNETRVNRSPPATDHSVTNRRQDQQNSRNSSVTLSPQSKNGYHQGASSPKKNESFALVPHEAPDQLGSILNALQKAKLSLTQQIKAVPSIDERALGKSIGVKPEDPAGFRGLFRVPSDFHLEPNNHDPSSRLSLTHYYPSGGNPPTVADRSFSRPYPEAGSSAYGSERHYSTPNSPYRDTAQRVQTWQPLEAGSSAYGSERRYSTPNSPYREAAPRVPTWQPLEARSRSSRQPFSDPGFDAGAPYLGRHEFNEPSMVRGRSYINPYASPPNYPVFSSSVPHIPSNQGPSLFSSSRAGMSPSNQFFYDEPGRPSTYR